jgi:hypothetical protein
MAQITPSQKCRRFALIRSLLEADGRWNAISERVVMNAPNSFGATFTIVFGEPDPP